MKEKAEVRLTEDMKRVLNEQRLGFIASVCQDGTPNLSPKGTTTVWDDEHIIFADICSPGTVANVQQRPIVEINVVDPVARKGYRFTGPATVSEEGPLFRRGTRLLPAPWDHQSHPAHCAGEGRASHAPDLASL